MKADNGSHRNKATTGSGTSESSKETRECFFCKKKGHLKKDCRSYKREQKKKESSKDAIETGNKKNKKDDEANEKADVALDSKQLERTLTAYNGAN